MTSQGSHKRRFKNKVYNPLLQLKIGLYCIILSFIFSFSVLSILYLKFNELIGLIIDLTDAEDTVRDIISSYWSDAQIWILVALLIYILVTIVVCILYTHHLIGPTISFKKHIEALINGNYTIKTKIRKGDAFEEIATALNSLSDSMQNDHKNQPPE